MKCDVCATREGCLLKLCASREPREECLIAPVAVLTQTFGCVENRPLRFLSSALRVSTHGRLRLRADGPPARLAASTAGTDSA
jgi:hypothetical protein